MAYDVSSSIGELLYKNNSVIVPNFGGFMLSYRSAKIDYVQDTFSPPSKSPSFNSNLKINDGILIDHIKNQNHLTLEQAKEVVAEQVENYNNLFEEKEMIDLPKVGRLYKDYAGEIKFLPYDTNFNTNTFGLPQIQFLPIQRNTYQKESPATATTDGNRASTAASTLVTEQLQNSNTSPIEQGESIASMAVGDEGKFSWARKLMPFLIAASLALVAASFYFLQKDPHPTDMESAQVVPVNENGRLNTKPTLTSDEIPEEEINQDYVGPTSNTDDSEEYAPENNTDESNSTYSSGDKECVIIVGQFSVRSNARKFRKKVENDGYETYSRKNAEKGWSMIGVKFNYDSENEKLDMLNKLQNEYDDAAWIYKD